MHSLFFLDTMAIEDVFEEQLQNHKSQCPDVYTLKNRTPYLSDCIANMELI